MTEILSQNNFTFQKATKSKIKARVAIDGPSGSGKTYTALIAATALANGGKIAVIDTERGSASLYSDIFDFDVLELDTFSPELYTQAIEAAENAGYAVIVIDSLSHAWEGEGGALDMVDDAAARSKSGNSYTAWRDVTPLHRRMIDAILQSKAHVIATMRSKTEYILETNAKGQQVPRKIGMAPIQRAGMEYEFTVVGDMDLDHKIVISKSRFAPFQDKVATKPTIEFFMPFVEWLDSGVVSNQKEITTGPRSESESGLTKEKPKSNGNKWSRPMAPEVLKEALKVKAAKSNPASEKQTNLVRILLLEHFADREDERHQAQEYLTGHKSFKDIEPEMLSAILDWMKPEKSADGSGSYVLNNDAKLELTMVARQFMEDLGQQTLAI